MTAQTSARDVIFARIREALRDVPQGPPEQDAPIDWEYGKPAGIEDVLGAFVDTCLDYKAVVERVRSADVPETIARLVHERGLATLVAPAGIDPAWRQAVQDGGALVVDDDPPLSAAELDQIDAVVTAARVGIADTGTIVLDHAPDQGRRALTLVPDTHLCVIRAEQVVSDVPEAVQRLKESVREGRPLTWISGGSATSDIELSRVEGVHGPRNLLVVLAE
ncbi:MAG: lactate utilization protein C [Propionibacteriaceae bacterium]|jgi:L-lactate dehydrogenase complex protein LldG|nr:lactate utilization protein C [Propionibacteriaceae bacterium]